MNDRKATEFDPTGLETEVSLSEAVSAFSTFGTISSRISTAPAATVSGTAAVGGQKAAVVFRTIRIIFNPLAMGGSRGRSAELSVSIQENMLRQLSYLARGSVARYYG